MTSNVLPYSVGFINFLRFPPLPHLSVFFLMLSTILTPFSRNSAAAAGFSGTIGRSLKSRGEKTEAPGPLAVRPLRGELLGDGALQVAVVRRHLLVLHVLLPAGLLGLLRAQPPVLHHLLDLGVGPVEGEAAEDEVLGHREARLGDEADPEMNAIEVDLGA